MALNNDQKQHMLDGLGVDTTEETIYALYLAVEKLSLKAGMKMTDFGKEIKDKVSKPTPSK